LAGLTRELSRSLELLTEPDWRGVDSEYTCSTLRVGPAHAPGTIVRVHAQETRRQFRDWTSRRQCSASELTQGLSRWLGLSRFN
jgi:hypothetical protein